MRSLLGRASRAVNRIMGGEPGQTLCARVAARWGAHSWPCLVLDFLCREPGHCRKQLWADRYQK